MTNEEVKKKLEQIQSFFVDGSYWSHTYGTANDYTNISDAVNTHSTEKDDEFFE